MCDVLFGLRNPIGYAPRHVCGVLFDGGGGDGDAAALARATNEEEDVRVRRCMAVGTDDGGAEVNEVMGPWRIDR